LVPATALFLLNVSATIEACSSSVLRASIATLQVPWAWCAPDAITAGCSFPFTHHILLLILLPCCCRTACRRLEPQHAANAPGAAPMAAAAGRQGSSSHSKAHWGAPDVSTDAVLQLLSLRVSAGSASNATCCSYQQHNCDDKQHSENWHRAESCMVAAV
jgi:hypothetical protein